MGFVSAIKNLFKKKEEVSVSIEQEPPVIEQRLPTLDSREYHSDACAICGNEIGYEKWTKVKGEYVHKKCFRREKAKARKQFGIAT